MGCRDCPRAQKFRILQISAEVKAGSARFFYGKMRGERSCVQHRDFEPLTERRRTECDSGHSVSFRQSFYASVYAEKCRKLSFLLTFLIDRNSWQP